MNQTINKLLKQLEQYQTDINITIEQKLMAEQLLELANNENHHFAKVVAHRFLPLTFVR